MKSNRVLAWAGLLALAEGLGSCAMPLVTPVPGPVFLDPNGNPHIGVAVAGRDAGGPCLGEAPVCIVPTQ